MGQITASTGEVVAIVDEVGAIAGGITVTLGQIAAIAGEITVIAGQIAAIAGGIAVTLGQINAIVGEITVIAGKVVVIAGEIAVANGFPVLTDEWFGANRGSMDQHHPSSADLKRCDSVSAIRGAYAARLVGKVDQITGTT